MITLSREVLDQELKLAASVIEKWRSRLSEGIPGQDIPAGEDMAELWIQEFYSEMFLISQKLNSIADITANNG